MMGAKPWQPINRGLKSQGIPRSRSRSRPLRSPYRHASVPARRVVHAKALGCHAQRRCRRFVAGGQRESADRFRIRRSTSTRTSPRPSMSCRSRATPSIFHPKANSVSTAAALAETNGSRSPKVCRKGTATSTYCGMPWRLIRSTRAECILAPPADRFTHRRRRGYLDADRPGPSCCAFHRGPDPRMIRVVLPGHLRTLARISGGEVDLDIQGPVTQRSVLDALEAAFPMLRGTIRDHVTLQRRPFLGSLRARRICRTNRRMLRSRRGRERP